MVRAFAVISVLPMVAAVIYIAVGLVNLEFEERISLRIASVFELSSGKNLNLTIATKVLRVWVIRMQHCFPIQI